MEFKNGIAFKNNRPTILHISEIIPLNNYILKASFENGEKRFYDFKPLLKYDAFTCLQDKMKFKRVTLDHGIPTWEKENVDISPETIYLNGRTEL